VLSAFNPNAATISRCTGTFLKGRFSVLRSKLTVLNANWIKSGNNDPDLFDGFCDLSKSLDRATYYLWLWMQDGGLDMSNRLLRQVPGGIDTLVGPGDHGTLLGIMRGTTASNGNANANNNNDGGAIAVASKKSTSKRKKENDNDVMQQVAATLATIADPKGRAQSRVTQLLTSIGSLEDRMNKLCDEMDPSLRKSPHYRNRRRTMYRQARLDRWKLRRQLQALEAGHDDVSQLDTEAEPLTDEDEMYYLWDTDGEASDSD